MRFGGFLKHSLIDYPGKISCVVFLNGCNFQCPYCHNPGLARGDQPAPSFLNQEWLDEFMGIRRRFLDGIVISGGEPTLQSGLDRFCEKLKQSGYLVKLDTNGSQPEMIRNLLRNGLVDYIAMDIKTDPGTYAPHLVDRYQPGDILESIRLIMTSAPDYEFRTTCVRPFVDAEILARILEHIEGARRYCLQRFRPDDMLRPDFFQSYQDNDVDGFLALLKKLAQGHVRECIVR
ncbi:MAG: anaerobic ribonucleoside-triphosphate reductase activating protein [Thermodesulfobacteriota bacterium]